MSFIPRKFDPSKLIVYGDIVAYRRRWWLWFLGWEYLVKLDDGREVWYWEVELKTKGG